jgi:hypothetical protein
MPVAITLNDPRAQIFLEWLCTPIKEREPRTRTDLQQQLGMKHETMKKLEESPEFLAAWETLYRRTVGSPEKAQNVLTELYETATDRTDPRQVQAAKAYLEAIDAVKPKKVEVTMTSQTLAQATDEELQAMMAQVAADELAARSDG